MAHEMFEPTYKSFMGFDRKRKRIRKILPRNDLNIIHSFYLHKHFIMPQKYFQKLSVKMVAEATAVGNDAVRWKKLIIEKLNRGFEVRSKAG